MDRYKYTFSKEDIQLAIDMKIFTTIISKMQSTIRSQLTPVRVIIQKAQKAHVGENVEKGNHVHYSWDSMFVQPMWKTV